MSKKIFAVLGSAATAAILATALVASAQTTTSAVASSMSQQPTVVNINAAGKVLLRGTIASISNGVIVVTSWGGNWNVNVGSDATVLPAAAGNDISQFKSGDFVGVMGSVSTSAPWTVDATLVRDWTYRQEITQQQQSNMRTARTIRQEAPRDYIGTASDVGGSSLTLTTASGKAYTVDTASNTEIVNRNWVAIPFTNIQNGNNVRVYGVNASGTVTAQIVRDVAL